LQVRACDSREELIEEVMYCGIAELRKHVQDALDALPPEISPRTGS
jgi:hypothetical protein